MVGENSELSEKELRHNFRLGDITWVKHGSSWWPAQVIDEACTSNKPKKRTKHDALVRLYGTCQCLYVDPWKCNSEFEKMLKQENKRTAEAFHEVIEKKLSRINSVNSKANTSSRKTQKQEGVKRSGHGGVNELASTEDLGDEEKDQEGVSNAKTGAGLPNGRKRGSEQLSARQVKIMQKLALIAPSGSPFGAKRLFAVTHEES